MEYDVLMTEKKKKSISFRLETEEAYPVLAFWAKADKLAHTSNKNRQQMLNNISVTAKPPHVESKVKWSTDLHTATSLKRSRGPC